MGEKKNQPRTGSHKALYRKYRSKSLKEIVGQEHITKTLKSAIDQGRLSHAYLFTGPRGTGKTSIARILAHEVNSLAYEDERVHLDIVEIDAASNRRIDDIRELREKVHIAPVSAQYKVYIIDEVHMLTTESFNALLKTLEEPPAHVIFILATTEAHKLPATIISRTQRHSFRFIPQEQIAKHLAHIAEQEGIAINKGALELLAEQGGGSFRDSISLLDQLSGSSEPIDEPLVELLLGIAPKNTLESLLTAARSGDVTQIFSQLEALLETGLTPSAVAHQLIKVVRQALIKEGRSTELLKALTQLLSVQTAQYPQLKLETALLEIAPHHIEAVQPSEIVAAPPAKPPTQTQPKIIEKTEHKPAKQPEVASSLTETAEPTEPLNEKPAAPAADKAPAKRPKSAASGDIDQKWPEILAVIKQKNNSIYTVLRLAKPEFSEQSVMLYFSFPFHQKKVEEAKHKSIVSEAISEVTGIDIEVRTLVDKEKAAQAPKPVIAAPDSAHASLISNVQDIMGGGEVVSVS